MCLSSSSCVLVGLWGHWDHSQVFSLDGGGVFAFILQLRILFTSTVFVRHQKNNTADQSSVSNKREIKKTKINQDKVPKFIKLTSFEGRAGETSLFSHAIHLCVCLSTFDLGLSNGMRELPPLPSASV